MGRDTFYQIRASSILASNVFKGAASTACIFRVFCFRENIIAVRRAESSLFFGFFAALLFCKMYAPRSEQVEVLAPSSYLCESHGYRERQKHLLKRSASWEIPWVPLNPQQLLKSYHLFGTDILRFRETIALFQGTRTKFNRTDSLFSINVKFCWHQEWVSGYRLSRKFAFLRMALTSAEILIFRFYRLPRHSSNSLLYLWYEHQSCKS